MVLTWRLLDAYFLLGASIRRGLAGETGAQDCKRNQPGTSNSIPGALTDSSVADMAWVPSIMLARPWLVHGMRSACRLCLCISLASDKLVLRQHAACTASPRIRLAFASRRAIKEPPTCAPMSRQALAAYALDTCGRSVPIYYLVPPARGRSTAVGAVTLTHQPTLHRREGRWCKGLDDLPHQHATLRLTCAGPRLGIGKELS